MVSQTRTRDYSDTVKDEADEMAPNKRARLRSPTRIVVEDQDLVPKLEDVTQIMSSGVSFNMKHISPKNLPPECMHGFRTSFKPAIIDLAGTLGPWKSPCDADVVRIWNACFPNHPLGASKGLHTIVTKLVEDALKQWRRDMATAAVACVNMTLKSSFDNQRERIARASWLLGDDDKDRKRPFYYKNYDDGAAPSGIFQSNLIASTLATHLISTLKLASEARLQFYPTGALALSVLAVKRALTWAKTGLDVIPRTSEGHFSRANWGDHHKLEGGRYIFVKSSSNLMLVIDKLQDKQWEKVIAEAEKCAIQKVPSFALRALLEREPRDQSDFELEDADQDL